MGRKPNQLILEFFIRGQKLEDASNRYQHTCKACGEKFPKGRIDSLTNHLVKKCQAIPLRDRQRVLLRLHELPDLADDPSKDPNQQGANKGKQVDLPYTTRQNFDGLNVLAEASRQVGASDHTKRGPGYTQAMTVGGKTVVVDPALEAEGFQGASSHQENSEENPTSQARTLSSSLCALRRVLVLLTCIGSYSSDFWRSDPPFHSEPARSRADLIRFSAIGQFLARARLLHPKCPPVLPAVDDRGVGKRDGPSEYSDGT